MAASPQDAYDELIRRSKEASLLGSCAGVLGWDRETHMPKKGIEHRAAQLSFLVYFYQTVRTAVLSFSSSFSPGRTDRKPVRVAVE